MLKSRILCVAMACHALTAVGGCETSSSPADVAESDAAESDVTAATGDTGGDTPVADVGPPDTSGTTAGSAQPPLELRTVIGGGLRAGDNYRAAIVVEAPLSHAADSSGNHEVWLGADPAALDPTWSGP